MSEFFEMGGYARYVWPSYAIALIAVIVNIASARKVHRRARDEARRRIAVDGEAT